jgi:MFS family permease
VEAKPDPQGGSRLRRIARAVATDITPLRRSRDFRLLWTGEVITVTGQQVTVVALYIQLYALTKSPAAVGVLGLVQFVPLTVGTLVGGPFIDRYDKRTLLLLTQCTLAASSAVLVAGAVMTNPPLWMIYAAAGLSAMVSGVDVPTRNAAVPGLVGKDLLAPAVALNFVMWNIAVIAGPAIGGIVVALFGLAWAYGIDLATYGVTVALVLLMRPIPSEIAGEPPVAWEAFKEGVSYLKGRKVLQSNFSIDLAAMIFGLPEALFPFLVVSQFGGQGREQNAMIGLLFSAIAVGALLATVFNGWAARVRHQGRAVVFAVITWGTAIALFGLIGDRFLLAMGLLAIAGGADAISAVFRSTILQLSVPDELRGRLSSIHFLVVSGGPRLGNLESGLVAELVSPTFAVVSGGLLCVAGAGLVALLAPGYWNFHAGGET